MSGREQREPCDSVNILLALARPSHGEKSACVRTVEKRDSDIDMLIARLKVLGGYWRIHRTVNKRDVHKAMKYLMCNLINHPEKASYVDSEWRTALLKPHCIYGEKKFMLDIDTQDEDALHGIEVRIFDSNGTVIEKHKSPNGWHWIALPFDTRKVCELPYVTLIRDGYYFVTEVGSRTD